MSMEYDPTRIINFSASSQALDDQINAYLDVLSVQDQREIKLKLNRLADGYADEFSLVEQLALRRIVREGINLSLGKGKVISINRQKNEGQKDA